SASTARTLPRKGSHSGPHSAPQALRGNIPGSIPIECAAAVERPWLLGGGMTLASCSRDPGETSIQPGIQPLERNPMPSRRFIASAIASIGLFAPLTQPIRALAQSPDIHQEDRREDRREDRQENRREDRREDQREDRREDRRDDAQLNVPRDAA